MTKMTKKDWFNEMVKIVEASDYADKEGAVMFLTHEIEMLSRKSGSKEMTKTQKENVGICEAIKEVLRESENPMTISEMMMDERLISFSNQKLSALTNQLVKAGEVVKTSDKKKSYFSIVK